MRETMTLEPRNPSRRYTLHMFFAMVGYCAVLFASVSALRTDMVDAGWLRIVIAILPVFPALYGLHAFITFYRAMDEFNRAVIAEANLWSVGVVGFISFAYAFAQSAADLLPEIGLIWILPSLVMVQGAAACIVRGRYS